MDWHGKKKIPISRTRSLKDHQHCSDGGSGGLAIIVTVTAIVDSRVLLHVADFRFVQNLLYQGFHRWNAMGDPLALAGKLHPLLGVPVRGRRLDGLRGGPELGQGKDRAPSHQQARKDIPGRDPRVPCGPQGPGHHHRQPRTEFHEP
eukprot:jgi/Psemu1/12950/gm1.12950_g